MAVATFEGIVEAGQIRLLSGEALPERATVYVIVPDYKEAETSYSVTIPANPRVLSPRLVKRKDAERFRVEISETSDAGV
jgi:hypothetical protein